MTAVAPLLGGEPHSDGPGTSLTGKAKVSTCNTQKVGQHMRRVPRMRWIMLWFPLLRRKIYFWHTGKRTVAHTLSVSLQITEAEAFSGDPEEGSVSGRLLIKSAPFPSNARSPILPAVALPETPAGNHPLGTADTLRRRSGMSEPSSPGADQVPIWRRSSGASGAQPRATSDMEVSRRLLQARWESYST